MFTRILVNAPFQQGQKKSGVEKGCMYLATPIKQENDITQEITIEPSTSNIANANDWKQDYVKLYSCLSNVTDRHILVGGDHSIGMSSVASSIHKTNDVNNLYVIWIDAHADCNTMEASITKNIHGQPLAGIMGYEDPWFPIKANLPFTNLLYFGIRDLDDFEVQKIAQHSIFNTRCLTTMLNKIQEILNSNNNAVFHVSFDVDALDSSIMKCTGCVVDSGLFPDDVVNVVNMVKHKMIAFDIVEFNPDLASSENDIRTSFDAISYIIKKINY